MFIEFLFAAKPLPPSCKATRKARKTHRDQEALLASELQAQSDLAPLDMDDRNDHDHDPAAATKNLPDSSDVRKTATTRRTRAVQHDIKNWVRRLTHLPKHHSIRPTAPTTPSRTPAHHNTNSNTDPPPSLLLLLPGELQNLITSHLPPVPLALLRLTCRYFYNHIPPPAFLHPTPPIPIPTPTPPTDPSTLRLIRCHRFAFLTTLSSAEAPSPYLPPNWNIHVSVCGAPFYPCTGCKAFHHLDWFAPYGGLVRRFPSLRERPVECRACVLHTVVGGDGGAEEEMGLYSPEVWPGFAERWRGWRVGRWWRCECCGGCVREGVEGRMEGMLGEGGRQGEGERRSEEELERWGRRGTDARTAREVAGRSPGRYLKVGGGVGSGGRTVVVGGGGRCVCGCDVCGMVGIDCWERGGRRVVLYRQ